MLAVKTPVPSRPLAVFPPVHPPEAMQDVAFVDVQRSVVDPPDTTLVLSAQKVTVGAATDALFAAQLTGVSDGPLTGTSQQLPPPPNTRSWNIGLGGQERAGVQVHDQYP